ncbi:unnamed protein product [Didymodactylos carnosus]|uniref:Regucalcin n=1 Tax=Didymodactylos carnosus TaxID=1234261 RepID=A0A8S2HQG3_9BILA|nr:unnamed protein product [Didymodactylos carnosus]CAF3669530.1 unnamed protein product [Didymodactylos carnosus]
MHAYYVISILSIYTTRPLNYCIISDQCHTGIDPESHLPNNRFNDGKCDPRGRLVAGTMHVDAKTKHTGALYSLNEKYNVTKLLDRVSISNGIVWSKDGHCMYYIDTFEYNVVSYDYNLNDGTISNRRVIFEFEESKYGSPDGMTIDENDNLWIAFWNGSKVRQFDPRQQKELSEINLPVRFVTSCAFGGSDLNDLYITCAASENKKDFDFAPLAGSLFVVKNIGVRGVPSVPFAGDVKSFLK